MDIASLAYNKLLSRIQMIKDDNSSLDEEKINIYESKFKKELKEDLNTANALTCLFEILKDEKVNNNTKLYLIKQMDKVLSINLLKPINKILDENFIKEIETLIKRRAEAKKEGNYEKADQIREDLLKRNIVLNDGRDKTTWQWKK